jgi:hypothetical protein
MKITAFIVALVVVFFCINQNVPSQENQTTESKSVILVLNFHNEGEDPEIVTPFLRIILSDFPRDKVETFTQNVCTAIDLEIKNSGGVHHPEDYEKLEELLPKHIRKIFSYYNGILVFFLPKIDTKYYVSPEEIPAVQEVNLLKV